MRILTLTAAILAGSTISASAATLGIDDFEFSGGIPQGGNCPDGGSPCLALNTDELVTMTLIGGGVFTLESFLYTQQGTGVVEAVTDLGGVFTADPTQGNSGTLEADLSGLTGFADITSVTFDNVNTGTVRIGAFEATSPMVAPVPLPAAGMMLLTALGGFAAVRRRSA